MKPILSLLVSGIRNSNWANIYDQMIKSCDRHSFEIIFVSPYDLPASLSSIENVRYLRDFGCPSRCLQLASTVATGEIIATASDDVIINEHKLSDCINTLQSGPNPEKDIVALKYTEGQNFNARISDFIPSYWNVKHHDSLRLAGINDDWKICLMFMMRTERFRYLGGIDCRFEHFNLNLHDMAFRAQRDGSTIIISKDFVTHHDWDPSRNIHNSPIIEAYHQNDLPLFEHIYSNPKISLSRPIRIDYNNWKLQPDRWPRRFS